MGAMGPMRQPLRMATGLTEGGEPSGRVFDVKRFATHDGPGVRTTVFLKGCSLRCAWCHNPEAFDPGPELLYHAQRCTGCGACIEACPNEAQRMAADGERGYDRERCELTGRCVEACYSDALEMAGRRVTAKEVMEEVCEDAAFYEASGGGVTLSGGEPLLQGEFATAILRLCKEEGLHTAVDTCGHVGWEVIEGALPYVDLVLYDVKHISPEEHRRHTGASNALILDNLRRLSERGVAIEIRMPIIPGVTDSRGDIDAAATLLGSLENVRAVRLLPYHPYAGSKYRNLGLENTMPDVAPPSGRRMRRVAGWVRKHGLKVVVPGAG